MVVTEVKVLVEHSETSIANRIMESINNGWELQGGISGDTNSSDYRMFTQLMVKINRDVVK